MPKTTTTAPSPAESGNGGVFVFGCPRQTRSRFGAPGRLTRAPLLAALAAVLALTGCTSRPDGAGDLRPKVIRAGQKWEPRELELTDADERTIEAHARFAAGVVEDLGESTDAALAHYLAAIANDPDNEILTLDVARKLVGLRRLEDARVLLEASSKRPPASGLVWGWLGTVYALQGNPKAAIPAHQEAIRRTPGAIAAYQNLVRVYVDGGQPAAAVEVLEQAASQTGVDAAFLIGVAETLGALQGTGAAGSADLRPRVLALLDRAAALEPADPAVVLRLADLFQIHGAGTRSLPYYERLLQTHPDLPGLRERLTEIYLRTDNREKAAEQLRVLAARHPTNPFPHFALGLVAMEARQFDEAITAFRRALVLNPDDPVVHRELALAHLAHNQPKEALEVLGRARARFRPTFELEFYSAVAMSELKQYQDAIRHFTAAEVIAGATAPQYLTHLFYFQSGVAYERAKRFDDAAVQFEKSIELKPDFADALNYVGYMWAEQGKNLPRALELIRKAVELEPKNAAYLDSLAWVLFQMDRAAEALPVQWEAVEHSQEPDATLFEHLGDIYKKLGRLEEARRAWQRSLAVESKPEVAERLKEAGGPLPAESGGGQ